MTTNYETGRIAVDAVIFTIKDGKLLLYVNTREKEPYKGVAELPGGLLLEGETAQETLKRKLQDVIGTSDVFLEQFHTFTDPQRDPRVRTISIAFIALVSQENIANREKFHEFASLPVLAFDHALIAKKAHAYLQESMDHQFARQFLPRFFTLNQLQSVYEVISGEKTDNRNFRKKILDSGVVKKASKVQQHVAHRPATLYQYVEK